MADKPQVSEHSEIASKGRGGSFIGALIKKIIFLAIIAGLAYGGWIWYSQKGGKEKIANITSSEVGTRSDKVGGSVGVGEEHKKAMEDALE